MRRTERSKNPTKPVVLDDTDETTLKEVSKEELVAGGALFDEGRAALRACALSTPTKTL